MDSAGQTRHALGDNKDLLSFRHPLPFPNQNPMVTDGRRPQPRADGSQRADSQRLAKNKGLFDFPIPMRSLDDSSKCVSLKLTLLGNNLKISEQPKGGMVLGQLMTPTQAKAISIICKLVSEKETTGCCWLLLVLSYCGGKSTATRVFVVGRGLGCANCS